MPLSKEKSEKMRKRLVAMGKLYQKNLEMGISFNETDAMLDRWEILIDEFES